MWCDEGVAPLSSRVQLQLVAAVMQQILAPRIIRTYFALTYFAQPTCFCPSLFCAPPSAMPAHATSSSFPGYHCFENIRLLEAADTVDWRKSRQAAAGVQEVHTLA
jgi:hypothetical protein